MPPVSALASGGRSGLVKSPRPNARERIPAHKGANQHGYRAPEPQGSAQRRTPSAPARRNLDAACSRSRRKSGGSRHEKTPRHRSDEGSSVSPATSATAERLTTDTDSTDADLHSTPRLVEELYGHFKHGALDELAVLVGNKRRLRVVEERESL